MNTEFIYSSVLVVDDEKEFGKIVQEILERMGIHVLVAYDGRAALTLLKSATPDLMLLDIMMPEIDGLTLLRWIRADPKLCKIPAIVVSAKVTKEDQLAALEAGADAFIEKPMTLKVLEAAIRKFLPIPAWP
jgi:CheY-like chemotaxis protein